MTYGYQMHKETVIRVSMSLAIQMIHQVDFGTFHGMTSEGRTFQPLWNTSIIAPIRAQCI